MRTVQAIRELRAAKTAEARAILAGAESQNRQLTPDEVTAFEAIKKTVTELEAEESRAAFLADAERRSVATPVTGSGVDTFAALEQRVSIVEAINCQIEGRSARGATGEYAQEVAKRSGVAGIHVPLRAFEKRAPNTTTTAAPIVPDDFRAEEFIGPLRNSRIVQNLGVRTITGLRGDAILPRQKTSMTAQWLGENDTLSESGLTFDNVRLQPRHVGALCELSRQLLQQSSPSIEDLVRADMSQIIAEAFDAAILDGDGVKEPLGLLNTVGIGTAAIPTTWANILTIMEQLELANATPTGWLTNPTIAKALRGTLKSATAGAEYLWQDGRMGELPAFATNQVPTGRLIVGDWSQLIVGVWESVTITVNPYANPAFGRGGVYVRALMTADIGVRQPGAFVVASA